MAKKKILFMSSNDDVAKQIAGFLSEFLYQVHTCNNSTNALELALSLKPDLVLSEDTLDVLSGKELARLFKNSASLREVPFLLLTSQALNLDDMMRIGQPVWVDDIIRPPITQTSIYSMVTQWLEADERPMSIAERWTGPMQKKGKEVEEKTWKKGKIDCKNLSRLLFHIARHSESGIIKLQKERRHMELIIDSGHLVNVKSNYIRADSLGAFLVRMGKITEKENKASIAKAQQEKIPQGQVLVRMDLLEKSELNAVVTKQKKLKVMRLFRGDWRGASFNFSLAKVDQQEKMAPPISLMEILCNGILRVAPSKELFDVFLQNDKIDCPIHFRKGSEKIIEKLLLSDDMIGRAKSLKGKSIGQIHNTGTPRFDEYLRLAFLLVITHTASFEQTVAPRPATKIDDKPQRQKEIKLKPQRKRDQPAWDVTAFQKALAEGKTFLDNKDYTSALTYVDKALKINPESSEAICLKAWARYNLRHNTDLPEVVQCKEWLKKAINLDETNDLALLYLGIIFKDEGKPSIALMHFKKAYAQNPANEATRREIKLAEIKKRSARDKGFRV